MSLQSTPPPESATDWWDIADQLTPEQINELSAEKAKLWAVIENGSCSYKSDTPDEHERRLLNRARRYARDNLLSALVGPIEAPDGAANVGDWEEQEGGIPHRLIMGADRPITDEIELFTSVYQFADGSIDDERVEAPAVFIGEKRIPLERVPVMISALQDCLAEIEQWKGTESI